MAKSSTTKFLKKKEKYDPKKAIEVGRGKLSTKNINKKRIFKNNLDNESDD